MAEGPYLYLSSADGDEDMQVPKMYMEAMRWPDLWQPVMDEELQMMEDRGVFELVNEGAVPEDKNIVGCQ